jgi:hypothetical protein
MIAARAFHVLIALRISFTGAVPAAVAAAASVSGAIAVSRFAGIRARTVIVIVWFAGFLCWSSGGLEECFYIKAGHCV